MTRPHCSRPLLAAALGALCLLPSPAALACAFHNYAPSDTVVDRMLGSSQVVFARPDPARPARYIAVTALSGPSGDVGIEEPVDPQTAQKLADHPQDSVLFARDGDYGPWVRLTYLDPAYREVIERIATRLEDWQMGGDEDRAQMFAGLLDHPNAALHRLALTELDLLPYDRLRRLDLSLSAPMLAAELGGGPEPQPGPEADPLDLDPIRVLLIGLSGDPDARQVLRDGLTRSLATPGSLIAGAYATALIELTGADGLAEVAAQLTGPAPLAAQPREMLTEALAIHAQTAEMGPAIHARMAVILDQQPDLAGAVARQFGSRYDWSQVATLQRLMQHKRLRSAPELISVVQYLTYAQEAGDPAPSQ